MKKLTLKEKIAQMFIIGFEGDKMPSNTYFNKIKALNC